MLTSHLLAQILPYEWTRYMYFARFHLGHINCTFRLVSQLYTNQTSGWVLCLVHVPGYAPRQESHGFWSTLTSNLMFFVWLWHRQNKKYCSRVSITLFWQNCEISHIKNFLITDELILGECSLWEMIKLQEKSKLQTYI